MEGPAFSVERKHLSDVNSQRPTAGSQDMNAIAYKKNMLEMMLSYLKDFVDMILDLNETISLPAKEAIVCCHLS
jgi:hypothetical protein